MFKLVLCTAVVRSDAIQTCSINSMNAPVPMSYEYFVLLL